MTTTRYYQDTTINSSLWRVRNGAVEMGAWYMGWQPCPRMTEASVNLFEQQGIFCAIEEAEAAHIMTYPWARQAQREGVAA